MSVNITNAHAGGLTGINGFDIIVTYNTALLGMTAAGVDSLAHSSANPTGFGLTGICPAAQGCVFDTGLTLVAFSVELDCTFNGASCPATPGRSRIILGLQGGNAAANGVALMLQFTIKATSSSSVIIDPASNLSVSTTSYNSFLRINGFFQNTAGTDYKVGVAPNKATVQPSGTATATVSVNLGTCVPSPCGTPAAVTLGSRVVSPVSTPLSADPTVGVSFGACAPATCVPPFTSVMTITTTLNTVRKDVGVSGNHTIIVNATSPSITQGVLVTFSLSVAFAPIDFLLALSRNVIVLRPGENSPDIRFIDTNGNGQYSAGKPLVLDHNLNGIADYGDMVVDGSTSRPVGPQVRFVDSNFNGVYDLGETLVFDLKSTGVVDPANTIVGCRCTGTLPRAPNATETGQQLHDFVSTGNLRFIDTNNNGIYAPGETLVLDSNKNGIVDATDTVVSATAPRAPVAGELGAGLRGELGTALVRAAEIGQDLAVDSRIKFIDNITVNGVYNPGEPLVFDASNTNTVTAADTILGCACVAGSVPVAPGPGDIGKALLSAPQARFIDKNNNGLYDFGLVIGGPTPAAGTPVRNDLHIKFVNTTNTDTWARGKAVVYDTNNNGVYDTGEPVILGPTPATGTRLKIDTKIKYVELQAGNFVWEAGEPVVYDTNNSNVYDTEVIVFDSQPNGMVDASDQVVSTTTPRAPIGRIKFIDGPAGPLNDLNRYNQNETIVFDANNNNIVDAGDLITGCRCTGTLPRAPNATETGKPLLEVEIAATVTWTSGGPETVALSPHDPRPLDPTVIMSVAHTSGIVSGAVVAGVESRLHGSTIAVETQVAHGAYPAGALLPLRYDIPLLARSVLSGTQHNQNLTLIVAPLGYRADLPFDYKVIFPAPAANTVKLDPFATTGTPLAQSVTLSQVITINVTQGIPQNITLTPKVVRFGTAIVEPTITVTYSIPFSTSGFNATITITSTAATPSGAYTVSNTAAPAGATPAQEVISDFQICTLFQGDVNKDGAVNGVDLGRIGAAFLKSVGQPGYDLAADVNKDGTINGVDLGLIGSNFLKHC
jgi:hypothetical protein